jgi:hypothetical protein
MKEERRPINLFHWAERRRRNGTCVSVEGNVESIAETEVLKMEAARICELCKRQKKKKDE